MSNFYKITGEKTISNRNTLDLIPFTANNKKNLNVTRYSRDKRMIVHYVALAPITDFEAKTSLSLFKMCLDNAVNSTDNAVKKIKDYGEFIKIDFDLRALTRFITGRTTKEQRLKIFKSLKKVAGMQVDITVKATTLEPERVSVTSWIDGLKTEDNYESCVVWVSSTALIVAASDGIAYNLKFAVQNFTGRALLLYLHLQTWKYEKNGKYGYQHYIPHESIAQALDLNSIKDYRNRIQKVRVAFKELESKKVCRYLFNITKNRWEKQHM